MALSLGYDSLLFQMVRDNIIKFVYEITHKLHGEVKTIKEYAAKFRNAIPPELFLIMTTQTLFAIPMHTNSFTDQCKLFLNTLVKLCEQNAVLLSLWKHKKEQIRIILKISLEDIVIEQEAQPNSDSDVFLTTNDLKESATVQQESKKRKIIATEPSLVDDC